MTIGRFSVLSRNGTESESLTNDPTRPDPNAFNLVIGPGYRVCALN